MALETHPLSMLQRFSHLLLYTVVLVSSYALEAPISIRAAASHPSNTAPDTAQTTTCAHKAAILKRRTLTLNAQQQFEDGNAGTTVLPQQPPQVYPHTRHAQYGLIQCRAYWQQRKQFTELLI